MVLLDQTCQFTKDFLRKTFMEVVSHTTPAVYSATKSGLIGLSRWISTAYGKYVRSNILSPGGVFDQQEKSLLKNILLKFHLIEWLNGAIMTVQFFFYLVMHLAI